MCQSGKTAKVKYVKAVKRMSNGEPVIIVGEISVSRIDLLKNAERIMQDFKRCYDT